MTKRVYCSYHPGNEARWYCKDCRRALCDECIEERRLSRRFVARLHRDERCRGKCVPLDMLLKDAILHPEKTTDERLPEAKPFLFMRTYEWRFIVGLSAAAVILVYMLILQPLFIAPTVNAMLYSIGGLAGWALCKRRHWGAIAFYGLAALYLPGYVLLSFPTETSLIITRIESSYLIPVGSLLFFTFALPEFNKR